MPIHYILGNLLAANDGALSVLFLDEMGETIDSACTELSPYQMQVLGAYLGIYLRQMEKLLSEHGLGDPRMLHIEKDALHIHVVALPDGYHLALVQRPPAAVAQARRSLGEAVEQLRQEFFS